MEKYTPGDSKRTESSWHEGKVDRLHVDLTYFEERSFKCKTAVLFSISFVT